MKKIEKGDIYLVNFDPAIGSEYKKTRPAIIIQSYKKKLITIMPISSKINKLDTEDILIIKNKTNKLFCDSIIKTFQITSFDKKRFIHHIGIANNKIIKQINIYLKKHFDL